MNKFDTVVLVLYLLFLCVFAWLAQIWRWSLDDVKRMDNWIPFLQWAGPWAVSAFCLTRFNKAQSLLVSTAWFMGFLIAGAYPLVPPLNEEE